MSIQYIQVTQAEDNSEFLRQQQIRRKRASVNARRRQLKVARLRRAFAFSTFALILGVILACSLLSTNTLATGADQASDTYKYYKEVYVESGDNLWTIAEEYTDGSVSEIQECISEIRSINSMHSLETLKAGTYIIVPYYSSSSF